MSGGNALVDASADDLSAIASDVVAFGLHGVPFSIVVSLLVLVGWTLSFLAGVTLMRWVTTDILQWVAGLVVLLVSAALSLIITARVGADAKMHEEVERLEGMIDNIRPSPKSGPA